MITKPTLPITELDFFQVKEQLKNFLRNDTSGRFRDIDFEGSNISVMLDVLAYNTYQNNFYTNMAISEMFLDSAQLENSVVSHAKELNYLPRSDVSARAIVDVVIDDPSNTDSLIVIPENTRFTTSHAGDRFNFYTDRAYIARREGNQFVANDIEIFEGELIDEAFFVTGNRKSIRLLNQNIDTSSIRVFENFEQPLDRLEYVFQNDIFGVGPDDAVFYLEPSFDGTYEVLFGNNNFGRTPAQNEQIRVFYRITNGDRANGACRFTTSFRQNVRVTNTQRAVGGAAKETIDDIKFFAPRSIQVQERAVTQRDYEILLKQRFNEIEDVSVFGGDELDPPRFGKVAIAVNIEGGLSDVAIRRYEAFLRNKTPISIQPIFLPPEFIYVRLNLDVSYSPKQTTLSREALESMIREAIQKYANDNLNRFGAVFEVSRVSAIIDSLSPAIINNTMDASPFILYSPEFNRKENPTFNFGSTIRSPCRFAQSQGTEVYNSLIRSSVFRFEGTEVAFEDNGLGVINIVNARDRGIGVFEFVKRNVGTVDYEKGIVKLSDFIVDSYEGNGIQIFATTLERNVTSTPRRVLLVRNRDITINMKEVKDR